VTDENIKSTFLLNMPDDIIQLTTTIFGNKVKASQWLEKPNPALNGDTPFTKLSSGKGIEEVKLILRKIQYGEFT